MFEFDRTFLILFESLSANANLSHSVRGGFLHSAQLSLEVDGDLKVQVPDVSGIWLHGKHPCHLLPLLTGDVVVQIEHSLQRNGYFYT